MVRRVVSNKGEQIDTAPFSDWITIDPAPNVRIVKPIAIARQPCLLIRVFGAPAERIGPRHRSGGAEGFSEWGISVNRRPLAIVRFNQTCDVPISIVTSQIIYTFAGLRQQTSYPTSTLPTLAQVHPPQILPYHSVVSVHFRQQVPSFIVDILYLPRKRVGRRPRVQGFHFLLDAAAPRVVGELQP